MALFVYGPSSKSMRKSAPDKGLPWGVIVLWQSMGRILQTVMAQWQERILRNRSTGLKGQRNEKLLPLVKAIVRPLEAIERCTFRRGMKRFRFWPSTCRRQAEKYVPCDYVQRGKGECYVPNPIMISCQSLDWFTIVLHFCLFRITTYLTTNWRHENNLGKEREWQDKNGKNFYLNNLLKTKW